MGVELPGLPSHQLLVIEHTIVVRVELGKVGLLLLRQLSLLAFGRGLPELVRREDAITVGILLRQGLSDGDAQDGVVRLGVEERGQLRLVQQPIAVGVGSFELGRLNLVPALQLLHLLLVATVGLVLYVGDVLLEREVPVLRGVNLLQDAANVLGRNGLPDLVRKVHDLVHRDLAVAVLVEELVQPPKLLRGERLLPDVLVVRLLSLVGAQRRGQDGPHEQHHLKAPHCTGGNGRGW
mmetsp:Transcript_116237/g.309196  ORF Transcript_116237/g.309196 Transcript_116237/m.309196 type:complete len:237 (+) Transcript_116237:223-933(+)